MVDANAAVQPCPVCRAEAVISSGGRSQAWVNIRTQGKVLELHERDEASVGAMKFTVDAIDLDRQQMRIRSGDAVRNIRLGESLDAPVDEGV